MTHDNKNTPTLWKACWTTTKEHSEQLSQILEDAWQIDPVSVSSFEHDGGPSWRVEGLFLEEPDSTLLSDLAKKITNSPIHIAPLADKNWITKSLEGLEPINAGRFFVAGSHDIHKAPQSRLPICIDAGEAFGTGHHGTTRGCLLMVDDILRKTRPQRILDLGCGSGVLAIAMAKTLHTKIWASDMDPIAVDVTRKNAVQNNVGPFIHAVTAPGFKEQSLMEAAPYDFVVANILARPLGRLAKDISAFTTPQARIILSGLLVHQERYILNAYVQAGFALRRRLILGEWLTLELMRPGGPLLQY